MNRSKLSPLLPLFATLWGVTAVAAEPEGQTTPPESATADTPTAIGSTPAPPKGSGLYFHFGGGSGMAILSSDGITSLFGDGVALGLGFDFSYSITCGYRNLAQLELRRGDSSHTIRRSGMFGQQPAIEIPMDYDFSEYVAKLNLLSIAQRNLARGEAALFVVAGTADISYLDKQDDGFRGNASVLGLEFARIAPNRRATASFGVRRYDVQFDRITLVGRTVPFDVAASNWVVHTALTVGLAP